MPQSFWRGGAPGVGRWGFEVVEVDVGDGVVVISWRLRFLARREEERRLEEDSMVVVIQDG
jgi:hypothetical protein